MPPTATLIVHTMEKVEDMDPATLSAGIPWDFETFGEYLASVADHGTVLNFAAYIGHTPLRIYVMGADASDRVAEPDEIAEMARIVREAIEAGACGFATSFAVTHLGADGRPIPSRVADRAEIDALCRAVSDTGRGVVGINGVSDGLHFDQIYDLQLELDVPITFTALLTSENGAHRKALTLHRAGLDEGRAGVAAGVAATADVLDDDGRAVHAEHEPGVRRADAAVARRAARRLRRPGVPRPRRRRHGRPARAASRRAGTRT